MLRDRAWTSWALLGLVALLLRPPAQRFLYVNEVIAASVARQVLLGAELYREVADWKGPLGYLLYAAVLKVTNFNLVAVHLMGWLLVVLLLLCAGALAHLVSGRRAAFAAGAFTLVFLTHTLGATVEMDLFMAVFSASGFLLFAWFLYGQVAKPALALVAGVLMVLALSCKQVALLDLAVLLGGCLLLAFRGVERPRARQGIWLLVGGVGIGALVAGLLIWRYSNFHDYLAWAWIIPAVSQGVAPAERVLSWWDLVGGIAAGTGLLWALGILAVFRFRAEAGQTAEPRLATGLVCVLLPLWLAAAVMGSLSGSQALLYHWTQAAVPLGVLASLGFVRCLEACGSGPWRRYLGGVVVAALALTLILPLRGAAWRWRDRVFKPPEAGMDYQVRKRLADMTTPEDYILVLDHVPSAVFWSGRRVASRYMMLEHLWSPPLYAARSPRLERWLGALADPRELFLEDVRRHPPLYILVPREQEWWENELAVPEQRRVIDTILRDYELVGYNEIYDEYQRKSARS